MKCTKHLTSHHTFCEYCVIDELTTAKKEITTLRFWREQSLHELKRVKDENKELRERLVANDR